MERSQFIVLHSCDKLIHRVSSYKLHFCWEVHPVLPKSWNQFKHKL